MKVAGIHHVTFRSQDPVAARRFYEEVVGLEFMEIPVSGEVTSIWRGGPRRGRIPCDAGWLHLPRSGAAARGDSRGRSVQ
jgi:catechol 2,3-dioxygenase-like lactoylglutathione lyase family enzyme